MNALQRAALQIYARSRGFLAHYDRALATVERAIKICQRPYVAFSAGKDSEAMLWTVWQIAPQVPARILTGWETRLLYPDLDDVLAWWRKTFPASTLEEVYVDRVTGDWAQATFYEQWVTFKGAWITDLMLPGADGIFIGLRAQESRMRALALRLRNEGETVSIYHYKTESLDHMAGMCRICPLDKWTTDDVGALLVHHEIPMLSIYAEDMEARSHYRLGWRAMRLGQLMALRGRNLSAYNTIIARFPELEREVERTNMR